VGILGTSFLSGFSNRVRRMLLMGLLLACHAGRDGAAWITQMASNGWRAPVARTSVGDRLRYAAGSLVAAAAFPARCRAADQGDRPY
jgi:hypothetical protein